MTTQSNIHYNRIAEAIEYISSNFRLQPNLDEVAAQVHLSPAHFQRLFTEWAGTSPKKFLQYISVEHAKKILEKERATLFDTAYETGLSSTSRLHDLFVNIEGMTPAEYKNGGKKPQHQLQLRAESFWFFNRCFYGQRSLLYGFFRIAVPGHPFFTAMVQVQQA